MKWILEISRRFAKVNRKGKSNVTGVLSTIGLCIGVMTLITVMGVMNGFQMSFIDAIMEISSYHLRITEIEEKDVQNLISENEYISKNISSVVPFYESQGLIVGRKNREVPVLIRGIPEQIMQIDDGFKRELKMIRGSFSLDEEDTIVLGSELANSIGVYVGSEVSLLALSGGKDVPLFSKNRKFYVSGIFESGYLDINSTYAFVGSKACSKLFGEYSSPVYGIKLVDSKKDLNVKEKILEQNPDIKVTSWREFNRTFFGALRIEKNIMMLLVLLIFLVVGVNIYNGMRRLVYERKSEISILNALGGSKKQIHAIFIFQGLSTGIIGSLSGLILGLIITSNMDYIFIGLSRLLYGLEYFFTMIFSPSNLLNVQENPMFSVYAAIPARVNFGEIFFITAFGIISPLIAVFLASKNVLKMNIAEVLHDE